MESNRKRRILFTGEASFLATGFANYWNEVLKRLYETGEFSIAEMGSYAHDDDQRCQQVPWKFYPVAPARSNQLAIQKYMANPTSQFGEWRFDDVCLDFKPDLVIDHRDFWMCFDGDTPIVMSDGSVKDIKNISEEDKILTHRGNVNKVTNKFHRKYNGNMLTIKVSNLTIPIKVTSDHPLLVMPRHKDNSLNKNWNLCDPEWKNSQDITRNDFLCLPISKNIVDDDRYQVGLCRLIGYYLANGCLLYKGARENNQIKGIQIVLNCESTEYMKDICELIKTYFSVTPTVYRRKNCNVIRVFNKDVGEFFISHCCEYAINKRISNQLYNLPNEKIAGLLCGLTRGDGCLSDTRGSYNTISKNLAYQAFMLFCRLGIIPSMSHNKNVTGIGSGDHYRYIMDIRSKSLDGFRTLYVECRPPTERDTKRSNEDYVFLTVKNIKTELVESHDVYNFEVEKDNSYVTSFAVHNCEFIDRSQLRNNFSFVAMPTIDGEPQRELWLDMYKRCDGILTYSKYGMDLLERTCRRGTKLVTIASPGVDLEMFKPPDSKRDHKARLGIDPNSLIVGTVMRNQKRKLYYDLIEAFSMWLQKSKSKGHLSLAKRTFLYLHTSYPDVGYDIGKAIRDFKIGNKVIMTYLCNNCQAAYPSFFAGEMMICRKCGKLAAHPPNANHSCPRNVLADIMKTFDLYVQYSICLHPDTPIMTSDGWDNIGDIKVGDQVIGKDGKLHRVYKTMRNQSDKCLDITIKGRPWSVTATDNHPWLVVDRTGLKLGIESIVNRERSHCNRGNECPELKFVYKRTDELQQGDLLASRVPTEECLPEYDLPFMDEDMAYYLGLFAADGHANESCGQCVITSHKKESSHIMELCQSIASRLNKDAKQYNYDGREAVNTNICDTKFRNQIRSLCYHTDDRTKTLPSGCHLWPIKLQKELVKGLIYGDGHWKRDNLNIYATTSIHIAKILGPILDRIGWYYCCHIQYRDGRLPMYRFEIRTDGQRKSHETLYIEGFILTKVASSNLSDFDGEVVNIDVEDDHHYVTLEGLQHNCEGFGMPCVDAIACGVPVAAVDYSAMQDHLKCPTSIPIGVERFFWEAIIETEQRRALPSNQDFVNKLDRFLKQSESVRNEKSKQTRAYAEELVDTYGQDQPMSRYSWERTAAIWGQVIRETEIHDQKTTWLCPTSRVNHPNLTAPSNNLNNSEFVNWVIGKVWNRPDMLRTHFAGEWLKSLNSGSRTMGDKRVPFDRKALVDHFIGIIQNGNVVEEKRLAILNRTAPDQVNVTIM